MVLGASQTNQRASHPHPSALLGHQGIAHTVLRPSGTAIIEGNRLDVVAESGMIEKGSAITVVAIEGTRIIVRSD